ncbi:hypothetical protein MC885_002289 [Smutsia gigantea]|nr:hypothetical protein MC885_002289 [Smutsia gigantea]
MVGPTRSGTGEGAGKVRPAAGCRSRRVAAAPKPARSIPAPRDTEPGTGTHDRKRMRAPVPSGSCSAEVRLPRVRSRRLSSRSRRGLGNKDPLLGVVPSADSNTVKRPLAVTLYAHHGERENVQIHIANLDTRKCSRTAAFHASGKLSLMVVRRSAVYFITTNLEISMDYFCHQVTAPQFRARRPSPGGLAQEEDEEQEEQEDRRVHAGARRGADSRLLALTEEEAPAPVDELLQEPRSVEPGLRGAWPRAPATPARRDPRGAGPRLGERRGRAARAEETGGGTAAGVILSPVGKRWTSGFGLDHGGPRSRRDRSRARVPESTRGGAGPAELRRSAHVGR